MSENSGQDTLQQRLKWLAAFRLVFSGVLVVATVIVGPGYDEESFGPLFLAVLIALTATHLFAAAVFWGMQRHTSQQWLPTLAYGNICWDLLFTASLIYVTGGVESELKFMFWFPIAFAAILLFRIGAFTAATLSGLLYGLLANFELFGVFPVLFHVRDATLPLEEKVFNSIILNTGGFFIAAYLFSYLSVRLRQTETILEEKQTNLADLEVLMGRIVESLTSGLVTLNGEGRVSYWSRAAEEITELSTSEVQGKSILNVFPDARKHFQSDEEIFSPNSSPWRWEMAYRSPKRGDEKTLGFSVSALRQHRPDERGTLIIFQDLTKYRAMEEQVKRADRLAAVGEVAARIAHEIRNPLTSVSGAIQVLQAQLDLEGEDNKLMNIVVRETDRLNSLLGDFLQFARPGKTYLEEVLLDELVRETAELFSKSHGDQRVQIKLDIEDEVLVQGDPKQLSQVFWNLIKNASEAMAQGGTIRIEVHRDRDRDQHVVINIMDEGLGISEEVSNRIFQPFFTTKTRGSGLGLAVVRRVVEDHGGMVVVENRMEGGAVARVRLPIEATNLSAAAGAL